MNSNPEVNSAVNEALAAALLFAEAKQPEENTAGLFSSAGSGAVRASAFEAKSENTEPDMQTPLAQLVVDRAVPGLEISPDLAAGHALRIGKLLQDFRGAASRTTRDDFDLAA